MDRRRFLISLAGVPFLLVACGDDEEAGSSGNNQGSSGPVELKDLIVGTVSDATNVQGDTANVGMSTPNANIYETLMRMDEDLQIQPHLAERWEFKEPNTWMIYLRRGVKFHDGTELTARDVVYTFDRIARARGENFIINAREGNTKALDDYTVEYTPARPNRKVPGQLVHQGVFGIMKAGSDPVNAPIGTGPLKFVSYTPKESFTAAINEAYWDTANPTRVKTITWKYIPDNNARVLALQAGDVDVIQEVPRESATLLKNNNKFRLVLSPVGRYEVISINVNGADEYALTRDAKIREAIARGIDRETIVTQVWEGNAELGKGLNPPSTLGSFASRIQGGAKYDPEGAKKILDDLGWRTGSDGIRSKDGQRLQITLVSGFPTAEVHRPIPEVIQSQLRKVGIDVKIEETTAYDATLASGKGHLYIESGNYNLADPNFFVYLLYRSEAGGNSGSSYGKAFGLGGKVDELSNQAQGLADVAQTQDLVSQAFQILIDQQYVILPIAGLYNIWATSDKVSGFKAHPAFVHQSWRGVAKA